MKKKILLFHETATLAVSQVNPADIILWVLTSLISILTSNTNIMVITTIMLVIITSRMIIKFFQAFKQVWKNKDHLAKVIFK